MIDPTPSPSCMVIPVVIAQHVEGAAFHSLLRNAAVYAPHYSLHDLAKLDNRLDAHMDGLRINGEAGWEICKATLGSEDTNQIFAATVLAYESGNNKRIQTVIEAGCSYPELCRGVVSALGWLSYQHVEQYIQQLVTADSSNARGMGIGASVVHRQDPGRSLDHALSDNDPLLKARALRAVGQLGRTDLVVGLLKSLAHEVNECRFNAAWSAALLGELSAIPVLKAVAESDSSSQQEAVEMAVRIMDLSLAHHWRKEMAQKAATCRLAVIAAGVIGDPISVPWLIEQMSVPELARVAGESFTMITGVDIAYEDLEGEWPEGFESGPTEDPEDENVEMDSDENLPWPNPELIQKWWNNHRSGFQSGTRYLMGKPIAEQWLQQVLRIGRQRQRAAAALELALRRPGQPLFEVRAPGFRQQQMLGLKVTR